jgi:hypothetical protein
MARSGFCGFYVLVGEPGTSQAGASSELLSGLRRMGIAERLNARTIKRLG